MFGFSFLAMFGVAGMGLDGMRAHRVASRAISGLDAAALAAARAMSENDNLTPAEVIAIARQVFADNSTQYAAQGVTASLPLVVPDRATGTVQISTDLRVATTLARVARIDGLTFTKSVTVSFAARKIELAMVLDVTGSMNDLGKIDAMKTAATDVINGLIDPNKPNTVRIALVPYSAAVKVAPYQAVASGGDSLDGCVMERMAATNRDTDAAPGFTASSPDNFAVSGQLNSTASGRYVCPAASISPLSPDRTALTAKVATFTANGGTAGHIGIAWGWNVLSPNWTGVFTGANAPGAYGSSNVTKAMLLMTDGLFNTSYTAGISDPEQTTESVTRAKALCDGMKGAPSSIQIYTVGFQTTPDAEALLRYCASSASHYYDALDNAQLVTAFQDIAKRLQQIRIEQ